MTVMGTGVGDESVATADLSGMKQASVMIAMLSQAVGRSPAVCRYDG